MMLSMNKNQNSRQNTLYCTCTSSMTVWPWPTHLQSSLSIFIRIQINIVLYKATQHSNRIYYQTKPGSQAFLLNDGWFSNSLNSRLRGKKHIRKSPECQHGMTIRVPDSSYLLKGSNSPTFDVKFLIYAICFTNKYQTSKPNKFQALLKMLLYLTQYLALHNGKQN